jgi:hypothetical protein
MKRAELGSGHEVEGDLSDFSVEGEAKSVPEAVVGGCLSQPLVDIRMRLEREDASFVANLAELLCILPFVGADVKDAIDVKVVEEPLKVSGLKQDRLTAWPVQPDANLGARAPDEPR